MGESSTNILNLLESTSNLFRKSDLVRKILDLKGEVIVDADLQNSTERMNQIVAEIKKLCTNPVYKTSIIDSKSIVTKTTLKYQVYQTAFLTMI